MATRIRLTVLTTLTMITLGGIAAPPARAAGTTGLRFVDIAAGDVVLEASVVSPTGSGDHPAVVLPSSWGLNDLEYAAQAQALARRGYVVVSYTPRGWWLSGGEIDTAGPEDLADLTDVIDWTIANTPTDPERIGAAGVSYGAGISLLGAGTDPRIKAVGVLSGWTDLAYSLYAGQTRHRQAADLLGIAASTLGDPSAELEDKLADFAANRDVDQVIAWAGERSAQTYLGAINANRPAVLIANAWGDSFFPPNQLAGFFGGLTGPKRLELRPGDHAIAELTGLAGLPNEVWSSLYAWFDAYVAGTAAPDTGDPVRVTPWNAAAERYPSWAALTGTTTRYGLGAIRPLDQTGLLGGAPGSGWSKDVPADRDTVANGGVVLITNGASAFTGTRPVVWLPSVDRSRAGVWAAERPASALRLRGTPRLHLELTDAPEQGTLVAYLYDLDLVGNASLVTHAPVSWLHGEDEVDVDLWSTAYDVPAGHSLTLVVDTADPLYYDENTAGDTIGIAGGSYLDVPLR